MKATTTLKISISGARGIIGDSLTPQLTAALAQAFGTYVGGGPILVGRDEQAEFDHVIVVEPAAIADESPQGLRALYVALTRPTQRLVVVHARPLPACLHD